LSSGCQTICRHARWQDAQAAAIDNLRPNAAIGLRLIGLAPGDLPVVTARTPAVNVYAFDLNER
jgi:hypothetical protein